MENIFKLKKDKNKTNIITILAYVTLFFAFLINVWMLTKNYWLVDSDMAHEMLLSKHMVDTGRFISKDWYYTTELRVFNINIIFAFFLFIFSDNWMLARLFGSISIYLIFITSIYYLFKATDNKKYWVFAAILLMLPASTMYWFLGLFGLCYIFYTACNFFIISCIFSDQEWTFIVGIILSLLLGLNGVKLILFLFAPLFVTALLFLWKEKDNKKNFIYRSIIFAIIALASMFGSNYFFKDYHYYRYSDTSFIGSQWNAELSFSIFIDKIIDLLTLFGYQGGVKLFSLYGIASGVSICLLLFLFTYHDKYTNKTIDNEKERYLSFLFLLIVLLNTLAFALLDVSYNSSYWIPCFAMMVCLLVMKLKRHPEAIIVSIACFMFLSFATIKRNIETPLRGKKGLGEVTQWLVDNGYEKGYASFWNADSCVEFSSGELEIWSLNNVNNINSLSWGQSYSHFTDKPTDPFIIIRNGELEVGSYLEDYDVIFENDYYKVLH